MLDHLLLQHEGSSAQTCSTHGSQFDFSLVPVPQMLCEHVVTPHDSPQTEATSPTQTLSHSVLQQ